ncbi:hypothetical protein DBV15_06934 [Temnothorax longispinosus]|uniref:Uncharacterized protein n=1 Tax=Temnothorax longispinosus TaxID=300112 RepID=A0A4S2KRY0_9HYME|nr:hypothetical protein DBV15_06934 [Temnothorax longispinosus]
MTRRPLQQLPFLRGVPRECSPVGQCISIGPSRDPLARAKMSPAALRSPRSARRAHVRATPASGKAEGIAVGTGDRTVSSLLPLAARCTSTGQRVKVTARRHASQISQSSRGHLADRYGRASSPEISPFLSAPTDSFTTPVAVARCGPFAKRDRPICFFTPCYAARYSATSVFIGPSRRLTRVRLKSHGMYILPRNA